MNNDQITALAREYAEFTDMSPVDKRNISVICENFLKYTLRRFCLVEKSKVEEEYKSSKHYFEHTESSNPTQKQYFWGRMCAIESLFPEIAKEVEG